MSFYLLKAKANKKHMKNYDENKQSLYLKQRNVNHLFIWLENVAKASSK